VVLNKKSCLELKNCWSDHFLGIYFPHFNPEFAFHFLSNLTPAVQLAAILALNLL